MIQKLELHTRICKLDIQLPNFLSWVPFHKHAIATTMARFILLTSQKIFVIFNKIGNTMERTRLLRFEPKICISEIWVWQGMTSTYARNFRQQSVSEYKVDPNANDKIDNFDSRGEFFITLHLKQLKHNYSLCVCCGLCLWHNNLTIAI